MVTPQRQSHGRLPSRITPRAERAFCLRSTDYGNVSGFDE
jgi:hypothetical protein